MLQLSWDIFIGLFFALAAVYGLILARDRITVILVSTYIALAVAKAWGEAVYQLILRNQAALGTWITNASLFSVQVGLFILFIILVASRGGIGVATPQERRVWHHLTMPTLGILTAGLILTSIFSFMPEGARQALFATSRFAALLARYELWWLVLPPLFLVATSAYLARKIRIE